MVKVASEATLGTPQRRGAVGLSDGGTDGTGSPGSGGQRVVSGATLYGDVGLGIVFIIVPAINGRGKLGGHQRRHSGNPFWR
jgi:hypothetical protein